jgi:signal transduction histidine kinase
VARDEVKLASLDLEALIDDVISHYAELQPPKAEVEIFRPLLRVRAHESSLGQCLANLLTNAAKFVEPGVRPKIRVRTERAGEARVKVWIEDNGIGIAPENQARLFRVFERVPSQHPYEGTGIGLAIVRKAVEKMGGTCGVMSDGKTGSRFWIELARA